MVFCLSRNLLSFVSTLYIRLWFREIFKCLMFQLLENIFASQKILIFLPPKVLIINLQTEKNYPSPQAAFFMSTCPPTILDKRNVFFASRDVYPHTKSHLHAPNNSWDIKLSKIFQYDLSITSICQQLRT